MSRIVKHFACASLALTLSVGSALAAENAIRMRVEKSAVAPAVGELNATPTPKAEADAASAKKAADESKKPEAKKPEALKTEPQKGGQPAKAPATKSPAAKAAADKDPGAKAEKAKAPASKPAVASAESEKAGTDASLVHLPEPLTAEPAKTKPAAAKKKTAAASKASQAHASQAKPAPAATHDANATDASAQQTAAPIAAPISTPISAPKVAPAPKPKPAPPVVDPKAFIMPQGPSNAAAPTTLPADAKSGQFVGDVSLEFHPDHIILRAATNAPPSQVTHFTLSGPRKLAIDLRGEWRKKGGAVVRYETGPVKAVVAGEHPDRLRLALEFREGAVAEGVTPTVETSPNGLTVRIPLAAH